jgi:hypothetical protein
MRTTLDIDPHVLAAAKELAEARKTTAGKVISDLARRALTRPAKHRPARRNGFLVLPQRGGVVTSELVQRLVEEEG